jgi:hypothetical protein
MKKKKMKMIIKRRKRYNNKFKSWVKMKRRNFNLNKKR